MKDNKEVKISYWAAHATTIVSVTLMLLLLGMIGVVSYSAASETDRLRERIEVSAVMADSVSNADAGRVLQDIKKLRGVNQAVLVTSDQAMEVWKKETGEDLQALYGINPLSPEINFTLQARYAQRDSIAKIVKQVGAMTGVEEVATPDSAMIEGMNRNLSTITLILAIVAGAMTVISFVLINNTVHLSIYARRFTIHTMQLVGATNGFIRRPFVLQNMLAGTIAGVLASGILAGAMAAAPEAGIAFLSANVTWPVFGILAGAIVVVGAVLCALAACVATTRYLRKDYDQLFK